MLGHLQRCSISSGRGSLPGITRACIPLLSGAVLTACLVQCELPERPGYLLGGLVVAVSGANAPSMRCDIQSASCLVKGGENK